MFGDNHDSDQSISEEEDLGISESSKNYSFSLCASQESSKQILSQLEVLRKEADEPVATTRATVSSQKRHTGLCLEDEIEFPVFKNDDDFIDCPRVASVLDSDEEIGHCQGLFSICNSDEEIISEEKKSAPYTSGTAKVDRRGNTWSEVNREVEALVCLNENTGSYLPLASFSKLNKSSKGGQKKVKPNSLFKFESCEKTFTMGVAGADEIGIPFNDDSQTKESLACADRDVQNSNVESQQVLDGRDAEKQEQGLLSLRGGYHDCNKQSVTEWLECLQEKSGLPQGKSETHYRLKGRVKKGVVNRNISALGDRNLDSLPDVGSSSEDEDVLPNLKSDLQQRTMADQFHEAIEALSGKDLMPDLVFQRESCNGLFEKLQHVMGIEKERDVDFLKKFGMDGNSTGGKGLLDVRILSRSLEAKLTVCCCALVGYPENLQCLNYFQMRNQTGERNLSIIFSSRICGNVELEVGNLIRIYSPWYDSSSGLFAYSPRTKKEGGKNEGERRDGHIINIFFPNVMFDHVHIILKSGFCPHFLSDILHDIFNISTSFILTFHFPLVQMQLFQADNVHSEHKLLCRNFLDTCATD